MTELLALHAVVEAAPDRVADLLLDVRPGGRSPVVVADEADGDQFIRLRDGTRWTLTVDRAARSVTEQSEWWFRSVTSVEPDPRGSRVVQRIYNVAEGNGWAIRFLARGPINAAPGHFADAVHKLGGQLNVAAWVVD